MNFAKAGYFIISGQLLRGSNTRLSKNVKYVKHSLFVSRFCSVSAGSDNNNNKEPLNFERDYFRNIMEQNPKYPSCNFVDFSVNNENSTNAFVLKLRTLVDGVRLEENVQDSMHIDYFKNEIFTLDDFIETFYLLAHPTMQSRMPFERKELRHFLENIKVYFKSGGLSKCLILLHQMRRLDSHIFRPSVSFSCVNYIQRKHRAMTSTQIIEYCYFLHFHRGSCVRKETKFNFEKTIVSHIPKFTLDEIAVIAYGLFRSQNHPGTLLSTAISEKIEEHVLTFNEVQASVFSKFLHYSGRRKMAEHVHKILKKSISIIDKFTISTAIHMGCSGISVNMENVELMNCIIEKMKQEFSVARLKDIERLLLGCLYANIQLSEESYLMKSIGEFLNTKTYEIRKYPRAFLSLIQYLIMYGVYLDDQINFALSPGYFELLSPCRLKNKLHELLFIDVSVEIERPNYEGNRLAMIQRKKLTKSNYYCVSYSEICSTAKLHKEILTMLENLYGIGSCSSKHLLPNYDTTHPILCLNKNSEGQEIKDKLDKSHGTLIRAPEDGNQWISFIIVRQQGCLSDGFTPNLVTEAKLRQFKAAGYIPVLIHRHMWIKKSLVEKNHYLHESLQKVLGNSNAVVDFCGQST